MKQNILDFTKKDPTVARDLTKELMYRRPDDKPTLDFQQNNENRRKYSTIDFKRALHIAQKLRGFPGQLKPFNYMLDGQLKNGGDVPYENQVVSLKGRKSAADFKIKRFAEGNEFEKNFNRHVDNDIKISFEFETISSFL